MDNNRKKINSNIEEWHHDIPADCLVLFERFDITLARSRPKKEEKDYDEDFSEKMTALYNTSLGIIKVPEYSDGHKQFKFWTMHTKVPFTHKLKSMIDNIEGIEVFDQYTPYRARIAVAPLFSDLEVKTKIQQVFQKFASKQKNLLD